MAKLLLIGLILLAGWLWLRKTPAPKVNVEESEARAILGVGPGADADAIRAAHRRLLSAVHPDKGGSEDLTQRINAARDTLLKRRS